MFLCWFCGGNYASLVGVLVEAVKEQQVRYQAEIQQLKAFLQNR